MNPAALFPYPEGWYCVGSSHEVGVGQVVSRTLAGKELVLFRGEDGVLSALDAHCPHMGAHMAHGGVVVDGTLRCPFHAFQFNGEGQCVRTGYGGKPPPTAKARSWPVKEHLTLIFVYANSSGEKPSWHLPEASDEGWTALRFRQWTLTSHVQEIAENSVDIGHFTHIHGYQNVRSLAPLRTEGPYLNARYAFRRPGKAFVMRDGLDAAFEVHQHGLGYARVEVNVDSLNLQTRQLVLAAPLSEKEVCLRVAMSVKVPERSSKIHPLLGWLPRTMLAEFLTASGIREFERDVSMDLPVWNNKRFIPRPALAEGDGPVPAYRRWAAQFYPRALEQV